MHNRKGAKPAPPKGCLWIEQAAPYIGLKLTTLRKWRLLGKDSDAGMHGFQIGRFVAYRIADLDAYLDGQYRAAVTPAPDRAHESRPPELRTSRRTARVPA
ncbi:hypothetical protein [Streptomyces sp. NPDC101166]|uniref:hypothetical protein n=1 Tax=Streptomyces sp. NPDC101166 TaxID=3366120 RepID=UPI00380F4925